MSQFAMRGLGLRLHRWLGLTAGVIFAIAAGTGAILVYADEIDVIVAGPRFQTTPGLVDPEVIERALEQEAPGRPLVRVLWPSAGVNIITARLSESGRTRDLVLDAGSGAVISPRKAHPVLAAVRRFHVSLFAGPAGSRVVWLASCATLVSLLLGAALWWPGLRRLPRAIRIRRDRGLFALGLDLHQTLGVVCLPLLLVMTLTGVLMEPRTFQLATNLLHRSGQAEAWQAIRSAPPTDGSNAPGQTLTDAVRIAQAAAPGAALERVVFPTGPDGIIEVAVRPVSGPAVRLALDRHNGAVLLRQELIYDATANTRLHFGLAGGPVVRALYVPACLVGLSLLPTGALLWWMKRSRRHT